MKKVKQLTKIIKQVYNANYDSCAGREAGKYKMWFTLHVSQEVVDSDDLKGALEETKLSHLYNFIQSNPFIVDAYLDNGIGFYREVDGREDWHEPPILRITFWFYDIETPNQIIQELGMDTHLLTEEDEEDEI